LADLEGPSGDAKPPEGGADWRRDDQGAVEEQPEGFAAHVVAGEVIQQSVSFRQAPYPTPEDLREYEAIHPGFTDRILTLTERETDHRIQQERLQDGATIDLARRGQTYAFIVVLTLVVGGIAAILTDHSIAGFAGLVLAAATLAGTFVAHEFLSRRPDTSEENGGPSTELEKRSKSTSGEARTDT
jgi:uncharacterized membrane protein